MQRSRVDLPEPLGPGATTLPGDVQIDPPKHLQSSEPLANALQAEHCAVRGHGGLACLHGRHASRPLDAGAARGSAARGWERLHRGLDILAVVLPRSPASRASLLTVDEVVDQPRQR